MKTLKNILYLLYKFYFMLVFSVLFFILFPFFLIGFFVYKNDRYIFGIHQIWAYSLSFFTFIFLRKEDKNEGRLPKGPYVIIANHTSYLDVFLMGKVIPKHPFVFMAKAELSKIPLFGMLFKYYHIPVYRTNRKKAADAIRKGKKALEKGTSLVIFPEGGIIDGYAPRVAPFKNGAFELAKSEGVAIVPITFTNNFQIIGEVEKLFSLARPGVAEAIIHPFLSKEEVQELSILELKKKCFDLIEAPLKERYRF